MKAGNRICWHGPEADEIGIVTKVLETRVVFRTPHYELSIPFKGNAFDVLPDDRKFYDRVMTSTEETTVSAKTKAVAKTKAKAAPAKAKKKVGKTGDGPSKMDLACDIVRKNPNLTRAQAIVKFIDEAKLTKAGAATYWALVNRKLKKEKAGK